MSWKEIIIRALKTGGQAAIAAFVAAVGNIGGITDGDALKGAAITVGIAVVSAFVSAVWNVITQAVVPTGEVGTDPAIEASVKAYRIQLQMGEKEGNISDYEGDDEQE